MYRILTVEDTVRVPAKMFDKEINSVIISESENSIVGRINSDIGIILAVTEIKEIGEGKIIFGDGGIYYKVIFDILAYKPMLNEVVEGVVSEITEFGAFVNFGPMDGLVHVSQITEDYMSYDRKNSALIGKESNKLLKTEDMVKARIVTVSIKTKFSESKIGLTMRQPYLGKTEWLDEEKARAEEKTAGKVKGEGKGK